MWAKLLSKLSKVVKLLLQGQFFLIFQLFTSACLPASVFRCRKGLFFNLKKHVAQTFLVKNFPDMEIRRGTQIDIERIINDLYEGNRANLEFYEHFYMNGIEPWYAQKANKIVGVAWVYTGYYISQWEGYDRYLLRLDVEKNGKFVANVFVDENCRGQRIFPKIADAIIAEYNTSPFYTCIDVGNFSSIRSHYFIGFRKCGCIYHFRLFQITLAYFFSNKHGGRLFWHPKGHEITVDL